MVRYLFLCAIALTVLSCSDSDKSLNKFGDRVVLKIADLQDRRNADSLYIFLKHEDPVYRSQAALAFASIQDSAAIDRLVPLLNDSDTTVRRSAAFSLGQIPARKSAVVLSSAAAKEEDKRVLNEILEAYGKTTRQWQLLADDKSVREGIAWSLYRAGLNNSVPESYHSLAATLLDPSENERTRIGAAHFFARPAKNIRAQLQKIAEAAESDRSAEVRMAATLALGKVVTDSTLRILEKILKQEVDPRVRVQAARAMASFPIAQTKNQLLNALNDKNVNVGIAASEAVKASITESEWIDFANRASDAKNWRIQANLYEAVLKVKINPSIVEEIKTSYSQAANPYQRAALLTALQRVPGAAEFIFQEMVRADTAVIRSSAAAALVGMNRSDKFQPAMKKQFAKYYEHAMGTGDAAVIGLIAGALADSTLKFKGVITDVSFLRHAKSKLSLPKDNEALQPLEAAIAYFENGKPAAEVKNEFNHPIDWALVKQIPADMECVIKTSQGSITIRLLVEQAPGSVANFVALARADYFDNKFFHRVVPNFVIQAGCNRGDGWGSEDYSIRSEFSPLRYGTGSMGMASAGKDTEGTQWFITHSPTPHLDGRYTIFAEVVNGMEVVARIEVGDKIVDVELRETESAE